jgi:hypothetical protein
MAQILFDQKRDFTGGLNFRADQFQLRDNETPFVLNLDVDPRGGVFSRAAYRKKHTTQVSGNWNPKDLFNYKHPTVPTIMLTTGFDTVPAPDEDGLIYHSTGSNFTVLEYSSGNNVLVKSENGASITQWQDIVYMAIGKDASQMYKWEAGTTYATSLLASGPTWQPYQDPVGGYMPRAEHARAHANKLFVANTKELNDDATPSLVDHPNRLRWSHENRPEDWFQDDYIDIIAGGEGIRGLAVVDGQLLIFKPKAIYLLMGYDADSFQLVELSTNLGIERPQHVVEGSGGAYFFDYPGGLFFFNRNGIQDLFSRLKPTIDTNRINAQRLDKLTLSYVNDRVWMSAPFDFSTDTTSSTSNPTGTAVDYSNVNFIFDPSIGQNGAFTLYQSATWYAAATPVPLTGYGLLSGTDWTDENDEIWHLMIHPDSNFKYVMYVDEFEYSDDIPQNVSDDIPEGDEMGDFETIFSTPWFYDDRYVQDKTFVRPLYVVRPVDENTQINVSVYHDFNTESPITTHIVNLEPVTTGGLWGTGVYGTDVFGESDLQEGIQRGGRLKKAKAIQLKFQGPNANLTGVAGPAGRQWGINSIAYKFKRRKVRSQK